VDALLGSLHADVSLGKAKLEQLKQERDRLNKEWMAQQEKEKTTPPASPSQPTNASHPTSTPLTHSAPTPTSKPETPNANIANEPKRVTFQDHSAKKPVSSTKVVRDKFKQKKLDQARGAATKSHDSLPNRPKPKMKISGKLNVVHIAHNVSEETSEMKTITKDDVGDAAQTDPLKNPPDDDGALPPRYSCLLLHDTLHYITFHILHSTITLFTSVLTLQYFHYTISLP
jgi:hypothetical protein